MLPFCLFLLVLMLVSFFSTHLFFCPLLSSYSLLLFNDPLSHFLFSILVCHSFYASIFISDTSSPVSPLPWLPIYLFYPCLSKRTMPFSIKPILKIYCTVFLVLERAFAVFLINLLSLLPGCHWEVSILCMVLSIQSNYPLFILCCHSHCLTRYI